MSTPERELPPLRVKILGDNSGFKKAHDEAVEMAKGMEEHIKKVSRGAGGVGPDKETVRRIKGMDKAYKAQVANDDAAIKGKVAAEGLAFSRAIVNESLLQKQRDMAFSKAIQNESLLQKQRDNAFAHAITNEAMLEKQQDAAFLREFQNLVLLERMKNGEFTREFQNEILLEKQRIAKDKEEAKQHARRLKEIEDERAAQLKADEARMKSVEDSRKAIERQQRAVQKEMQGDADKHMKQIENERALQLRADEDRRKSVEDSRKAIQKQHDDVQKEISAQADRNQAQVLADRKARIDKIKAEDKAWKDQRKRDDQEVERRKKEEKDTEAEQHRRREGILRTLEAIRNTTEKNNKTYREEQNRRSKQLDKSAEKQIKDHEAADRREQAAIRRRIAGERRIQREEARRFGGNNGLGNRADIYMHTAGIRNVAGVASSFVRAMADWQQMSVQMEGFTGSAKEADRVMKSLQEHAIQSPYGMQQIADSTRLMMAYGQTADVAMGITKQLGDIAGGDNEKLSRLSLGMAQIMSMGHLAGQELRQLTEHGFNPLMTMAKATAKLPGDPESIKKRYNELDSMKRKGLISSEAVQAALKEETSLGGKFYGMSERMSKTVMGLTQQSKEYVVIAQRMFMDSIREDLEKGLKDLVAYLKGTTEWMKNNQQAVREWAMLAKNVAVAMLVFHGVGMSLASMSWVAHSITRIITAMGTAYRVAAASALMFTAAGRAAAVASFMALGPIGMAAATIAAVTVAAVAAGYAIYSMNKDIRNWNEQTKISIELQQKLRRVMGDRRSEVLQEAGGIRNPAKRKTFLEEALDKARKDLDNMKTMLGQQKKLYKELNNFDAQVLGDKRPDVVWEQMKEQEQFIQDQRAHIEDLNKAIGDTAKEATDWDKLLGKGGGAAKYQSAPDHVAYNSAEHAKRLFDHYWRTDGNKAGDVKMDKQDKANNLLERIEKNTRASSPPIEVEQAVLQGTR